MTTDEIFQQIVEHSIKGLMLHSELADMFHFLSLNNFADEQEIRYHSESKAYRHLVKYYLCTEGKLLKVNPSQDKSIIPSSWYQYTKTDVDTGTVRNYTKIGFDTWFDWENSTKQFLCQMHKELISIGEYTHANHIMKMIEDVSSEIHEAELQYFHLKLSDYSIDTIVAMQQE